MVEGKIDNQINLNNTQEANEELAGVDIEMNNGFQSEVATNASTVNNADDAEQGSTLDEPVSVTIKRDLMRIWQKLRIVINPIRPVQSGDKRKEIRNWDLWGPFFFCLMLATVLSAGTNADDKTLLFELVFVIVWLGGAIIAINGQLLGGTISFFQSICLLGYCLFPLNCAALLNLFIGQLVHIVFKLLYVGVAFCWSTYSSIHFIKEMVPEDRKELAMYPVLLFYLFLSWFIIL